MAMDEATGSERHILQAHLDDARATVVRKVTGLTWEQATRRLGPTATSAAGILKHLADVERWWFRHRLAGEDGVRFSWSEQIPDLEFLLGPDDSVASLVAEYEQACDESRVVAAGHELTDQLHKARSGEPRSSLRWVYVHMIDEVARHNGQLDIYCELIAGQTDHD